MKQFFSAQMPEDDGFSSQEELVQQEIIQMQTPKQKNISHLKQQVKFIIPPPQQIKQKHYPLHPDTVTGWKPKIQLPSPIPLIFQSSRYDQMIKKMIKNQKKKAILCYLGPRFQNTYFAWYDKPFTFPYSHIRGPNNMKFTDRPFCGQHWEAQQSLNFNSFFQSGNLDSAIKIDENQYELFMRVDSNTKGHLQWFNFKVTNLKQNVRYKLNICNFQKGKTLFSRGMKPYVYSKKKFQRENIGWEQFGQNVIYQKKQSKTAKTYEFELNSCFKLSFQLSTKYQNDEIQVSYCIPYTYSQLSQFLHHKLTQCQKLQNNFFKMSKLCTSLGGLEIPLLIIHENVNKQIKNIQQNHNVSQIPFSKKCVIVCGRVHPGQSNASHMMKGFIQFICGESKQALFLRKHIIFKIVPMMNPDGVAMGNYRTGLSGSDFNRQYRNPDKEIFPQVFAFRKLVTQNKFIFKQNLNVFLDFHGHSVKKNTFVYGPQFPIIDKFYYQCRMFPKILGNKTPMFRYYSCSFKVSECKATTARAILLKKLNIPLSYTIQSSNGSYFDYQKLKDIPYDQQKWIQMGSKIGQAVYQYMQLVIKAQYLRLEKNKDKKPKKQIQIRRTGKGYSQSQTQKQRKTYNNGAVIVQGIQDQNIKSLFQEIKKAQNSKSKNQDYKCSDDEMSQGSSDNEGQQDNLSSNRINQLFSFIKNKKDTNINKCKFKSPPKKNTQTHLKTSSIDNEQLKRQEQTKKNNEQRMSQQLLSKKNKLKLSFACKKQLPFNIFDQDRKKSKTPRVINFSFGFNSSSYKNQQKVIASKFNFLDFASGKWPTVKKSQLEDKAKSTDKRQSNYSQQNFRKTFHSNSKQIKQYEEFRIKQLSITSNVFYPGNRRNSKQQIYRLKKMGIN